MPRKRKMFTKKTELNQEVVDRALVLRRILDEKEDLQRYGKVRYRPMLPERLWETYDDVEWQERVRVNWEKDNKRKMTLKDWKNRKRYK